MKAFAPGSVTALWAPATDEDEASLGASVAIEDGVVASVTPAAETVVRLDGDRTGFDPVERVVSALDVTARVDLTPSVPIGCGFGSSGAATLATALAATATFDLEYSRADVVDAAHRAELAAGTGQGDVFVQSMGGLAMDVGDGRVRYPLRTPLEYDSNGGIPTSEVLADGALLDRIGRAGRDAFANLPIDPTPAALTEVAWSFARETGLPTPWVRDRVAAVERAGGVASMALLGETVFAFGVDGVLPNRTRISPEGAHLL